MSRANEDWDSVLKNLRENKYEEQAPKERAGLDTLVSRVREIVDGVKSEDLADPERKKIYAERLRACRKGFRGDSERLYVGEGQKRGFTQEEVARSIGISRSSIQRQENLDTTGDAASIDRRYLEALALFFDISPNYLLGITNDPNDYSYQGSVLFDPLDAPSVDVTNKVHYMICGLYGYAEMAQGLTEKHKAINSSLLGMFWEICKFKQEALDRFLRTFKDVPRLTRILKEAQEERFKLTAAYHSVDDSWMKLMVAMRRRPEWSRSIVNMTQGIDDVDPLTDLGMSLCDLGARSELCLNIMCTIANLPFKEKCDFESFLKYGEFCLNSPTLPDIFCTI